MDVNALAKTTGGKKSGKGKHNGSKLKKFEGNCFWCGAYGHMMEDCQKKAAGKPLVPKSPRGFGPKPTCVCGRGRSLGHRKVDTKTKEAEQKPTVSVDTFSSGNRTTEHMTHFHAHRAIARVKASGVTHCRRRVRRTRL